MLLQDGSVCWNKLAQACQQYNLFIRFARHFSHSHIHFSLYKAVRRKTIVNSFPGRTQILCAFRKQCKREDRASPRECTIERSSSTRVHNRAKQLSSREIRSQASPRSLAHSDRNSTFPGARLRPPSHEKAPFFTFLTQKMCSVIASQDCSPPIRSVHLSPECLSQLRAAT